MNKWGETIVRRLRAAMDGSYEITVEYDTLAPITIVVNGRCWHEAFDIKDLLNFIRNSYIEGDRNDHDTD